MTAVQLDLFDPPVALSAPTGARCDARVLSTTRPARGEPLPAQERANPCRFQPAAPSRVAALVWLTD